MGNLTMVMKDAELAAAVLSQMTSGGASRLQQPARCTARVTVAATLTNKDLSQSGRTTSMSGRHSPDAEALRDRL